MPYPDPLTFLVARAAALCARAAVLREANTHRREQAEQTRHRANAAVIRAQLYGAYAADLAQQSRARRAKYLPTTLEEAVRARLAADELWRRRLAKRLRREGSG